MYGDITSTILHSVFWRDRQGLSQRPGFHTESSSMSFYDAMFGTSTGKHSSSEGMQDISLRGLITKDGRDSMLRRTPQSSSRPSVAPGQSGACDSDNDSLEDTNKSR